MGKEVGIYNVFSHLMLVTVDGIIFDLYFRFGRASLSEAGSSSIKESSFAVDQLHLFMLPEVKPYISLYTYYIFTRLMDLNLVTTGLMT